MVDARKQRIDVEQAWALLKTAKAVTAAKGKKFQRFENLPTEKAALLKQVIGPSGNLRAPTYRVGDEYLVGFNPELYAEWFK